MQAIGIMAFLLIGGLSINELLGVLSQPTAQEAVIDVAPFLAERLTESTLIAGVILALIVVAMPPIIMHRESINDQSESLFEKLGIMVGIGAGFASVGYLVSIGWVAAAATL